MNGIHTLIKLHQRELDTLRRQLLEAEEQRGQLLQLATQLHKELLEERGIAAEMPHAAAYMAEFEKRMQKRQLAIAQEIIALDKRLAELSAAIVESFGELKKYEITRDAQAARAKATADRREQGMLDEVAIQQFSRREDAKK